MNFFKGRLNRALYWSVFSLLFLLVLVMRFVFGLQATLSLAGLICIAIPRLHDIGRTGWLVAIPMGLELAMGWLVPGTPDHAQLLALNAVSLLVLSSVVWLGSVRGQPETNRFGPPPPSGIGALKRRVRSA
jgi:uncharacterized membrane protein YhaH (DUF805 family)